MLFIHQRRFELQTDIGIRAFADCYVKQIRIAMNFQYNGFFGKKKTVIQHVAHFSAVDGDKIVSASDTDAIGRGVLFHTDNLYHFVTSRAF